MKKGKPEIVLINEGTESAQQLGTKLYLKL